MVLIYRDGTLVPHNTWAESCGPLISDEESPYRSDFLIALPYNQEQKEQWRKILDLKNKLAASDYWPNKFIEGEYTEEEWLQKKAQRTAWREEVRKVEKEFVKPTITLEEMREAERKAMENIPKQYGTIL